MCRNIQLHQGLHTHSSELSDDAQSSGRASLLKCASGAHRIEAASSVQVLCMACTGTGVHRCKRCACADKYVPCIPALIAIPDDHCNARQILHYAYIRLMCYMLHRHLAFAFTLLRRFVHYGGGDRGTGPPYPLETTAELFLKFPAQAKRLQSLCT